MSYQHWNITNSYLLKSMYPGNAYLSLFGVILIIVSLFFLFRMTLNPQYVLHQTSHPRFLCFTIQHFFGILMLVKFVRQKDIYDHVTWGLQLSGFNSVLMIATESYIRANYSGTKIDPSYTKQPLELGFLNCYFLVFMYSLIGLFLTSVYLVFMKSVEYWQAHQIQIAISRYIKSVQYQESMGDLQCPICLLGFCQEESIAKVQCNHLFHKQCLVQWIGVNQNCPMCRKKLSDSEFL